jgi:hypothetical protein
MTHLAASRCVIGNRHARYGTFPGSALNLALFAVMGARL